jgi:hypothetical protein
LKYSEYVEKLLLSATESTWVSDIMQMEIHTAEASEPGPSAAEDRTNSNWR